MFNSRRQQASERVTHFYADLSALAEKAFPQMLDNSIDVIIKHQFINGLRSQKIRDQLMLTQALALTSDQVMHSAVTLERTFIEGMPQQTTTNQALVPYQPPSFVSSSVPNERSNQVTTSERQNQAQSSLQNSSMQPFVCFSCGGEGHRARECNQRLIRQQQGGARVVAHDKSSDGHADVKGNFGLVSHKWT